jgi:seryl-tRNA synthetase
MSRKMVLCFCEGLDDGAIVVNMLEGMQVEILAAVAAAVVKYVESKGVTPEMLKKYVEDIDVRVTGLVPAPGVN